MKKIRYFIVALLFASIVSAQEEFSFQLFFEDAIGHRDTITLGYDPLATDTIDTAFGEVNILNQPWSNSLDVRVGDLVFLNDQWGLLNSNWQFSTANQQNTFLSNKQILSSYCVATPFSPENASLTRTIQIHLNNKFPLKISWDKELFSDEICRMFTMFYGKESHRHIDVSGNMLLQNSDSLVINSDLNVFGNQTLPSYTDNGKEIIVLQFNFIQNSTMGIMSDKMETINIYPNPTSDFVTIDIENNENSELLIYQLDGTFISKQTLLSNSNNISISDLNTGVYLFKIDSDKGMITKKVIKN